MTHKQEVQAEIEGCLADILAEQRDDGRFGVSAQMLHVLNEEGIDPQVFAASVTERWRQVKRADFATNDEAVVRTVCALLVLTHCFGTRRQGWLKNYLHGLMYLVNACWMLPSQVIEWMDSMADDPGASLRPYCPEVEWDLSVVIEEGCFTFDGTEWVDVQGTTADSTTEEKCMACLDDASRMEVVEALAAAKEKSSFESWYDEETQDALGGFGWEPRYGGKSRCAHCGAAIQADKWRWDKFYYRHGGLASMRSRRKGGVLSLCEKCGRLAAGRAPLDVEAESPDFGEFGWVYDDSIGPGCSPPCVTLDYRPLK